MKFLNRASVLGLTVFVFSMFLFTACEKEKLTISSQETDIGNSLVMPINEDISLVDLTTKNRIISRRCSPRKAVFAFEIPEELTRLLNNPCRKIAYPVCKPYKTVFEWQSICYKSPVSLGNTVSIAEQNVMIQEILQLAKAEKPCEKGGPISYNVWIGNCNGVPKPYIMVSVKYACCSSEIIQHG